MMIELLSFVHVLGSTQLEMQFDVMFSESTSHHSHKDIMRNYLSEGYIVGSIIGMWQEAIVMSMLLWYIIILTC